MSTPAIVADDVSHVISPRRGQRLTLLSGVSLSVDAGESVAIKGRSGSGKSTLLSILGLLTTPTSGRLRVHGRDVEALSDAARSRIRGHEFGFVFQNYSLAPHMTVAQNIELAMRYAGLIRRTQRKAMVNAALDQVGLADRTDAYPRHLSGGEQQRVALARALVMSPSVVLADEPTGSLDETTGNHIVSVLFDVVSERGAALIIVTHDDSVAARADRRLQLTGGSIRDQALETTRA